MKKIYIFPSLLMVPLLASCGLFGKSAADRLNEIPDDVLTDRETVRTDAPVKAYTPEELNRGVVKGDWAIETVNGKKTVGEEPPYIIFEPRQKRVYGNNGCNTINASYIYNAKDSTFRFSDLISTMRECNSPTITDVEINQALDGVRHYSWSISDSDFYLYLKDASGRTLLTLVHQNFDFLNGSWAVTAINGSKENVAGMKLVVDIDEGKVHGSTGCNVFNGSLEADMDTPNSISFGDLVATLAACENATAETDLFVALEETVHAKLVSKDRVIFYDSAGKNVLELQRSSEF